MAEQQTQLLVPAKQDYYEGNVNRKVADFFLGFFGIGILVIVVLALSSLTSVVGGPLTSLLKAALYVLPILAIIWSITSRRRYITIGIASTVIIPLLLFGACLLAFAGSF